MKTILLLEDELIVMRLLRRVLQRNGYETAEAGNAEDAIRLFREANRQFDLLLADVTLPESSGIQIALLLRTVVPHLSVILTSGYPPSAWKPRDIGDLKRLGSDSVIVLQKPFAPQTLLKSIRELTGPLTATAGIG